MPLKLSHRPTQTVLKASIFLILLCASATSGIGRQVSAQAQNSSAELQEDLIRLDSIHSSGNLSSMDVVVNRDSTKWQKKDRQSFLTYMFEACRLLSSYDVGDMSKRDLLLSRYAISVLVSGDLPIEKNVEFVEFLGFAPIVVDEATWKTFRHQRAQLWLEAWRRLAASIDPTFDFNEPGVWNVSPPLGSGVPAGISPESIKDPKMRAEYERAIAQNSAKRERFNEQYYLQRTAPRFYEEAEKYLIYAYARPPADLPELERLLTEYVSDRAVRSRVLGEVRKSQRE